MPPIRGRPIDSDVVDAFRLLVAGPGRKVELVECIYCKDRKAKNTSRQRDHLAECGAYLQAMEAKREVNAITLRQPRLSIPILTSEAQEMLHLKGAMAVYMGARPFNLYEEEHMKDFLTSLNAAYKPLRREQLSGPYLDKCYDATKVSVESRLRANNRLNFVTDESTNIRKERIINLCCNVPNEGAYYICSKAIGSASMGAEGLAAWVLEEIGAVTSKDFSRVNSMATDTCNTMRSVWNRLQCDSRLQHALFVPCDRYVL